MMVTPPPADPADPIAARLARRVRLARWVLAWERLWPVLVPPLGVVGVFVAVALFDVLPLLPVGPHVLVLAGFAGAVAVLAWRGLARLRWPDDGEAARRLERDSGLSHRPLAVLADSLASDPEDAHARALWDVHRRRMAALVARLSLLPPAPGMAARDPLGLRAAVILLLVIAGAAAGRDAPVRLHRALFPPVGGLGLAGAVEVWITPPAYTGLAPVLLRADQGGDRPIVTVPAGSKVAAALTGGWGGARLMVDGNSIPFERLPDGGQRIEARLDAGSRLAIRQAFRTVASWPIRVVRDALPSIEFTATPSGGERGRLHLAVTASDDYGLARTWVEIRRVGAPASEAPLIVDLPLPAGRPRSIQTKSQHDLTSHPWAGLPVVIRPMAQDGAGQVAGGEPVTVTLPQREFSDPAARAIVDQRRLVTEERSNAPQAAAVLDAISARPELFHDDRATFLDLRLARDVLTDENFDLAEAQGLMWSAAVRIEDGAAASAERQLREAREELEKALNGKASTAELQRLMNRYQAAVRRMLEAVAQGMPQRAGDGPLPPDVRIVGEDDIKRMLERMRGLAATGSREALRQMLRDMAEMMDGLRAAPNSGTGAAGRAAGELRDLVRRQQSLLDRSFQRSRQTAPDGADSGEAAQAQAELGRRLGKVAQALGHAMGNAVSGALSEAGNWMGQATEDLKAGRWGQAATDQAQALESLREGLSQALERMGGMGSAGAMPRDPFGRPLPGNLDDKGVRIPDRPDIQRAHDILEELRRRANDARRPKPERDYLDRLLEQF